MRRIIAIHKDTTFTEATISRITRSGCERFEIWTTKTTISRPLAIRTNEGIKHFYFEYIPISIPFLQAIYDEYLAKFCETPDLPASTLKKIKRIGARGKNQRRLGG